MAGWPSMVELRICQGLWVREQRFLWCGFEEGAARRYEYRDGTDLVIYCIEPGFGIPLKVRRITRMKGTRLFAQCVPPDTYCQQIWTAEACKAGRALWWVLKRKLGMDKSICRWAAWHIAITYENRAWERARK